MKIRKGFVSNSSSSSFIITNKTDKPLTLTNFVEDFGEILVQRFNGAYGYEYDYSKLLECAQRRDEEGYLEYDKDYNEVIKEYYFESGDNIISFGDEDGDTLGHVFDYILRETNLESDRFKWKFHEHNR